jgi:hypothetical protein
VFLFVFGDFQTGHHGSDDPFHFSSLSELAIHVPPYVSHPAEFGDVLMTGTPFSVHLHLSNFRLSSFVDWPSLFLMFSCYANQIVCSYTLPYGVAHFSNRFCAKQYLGTTLSFSLSSGNLLTISTFLLLICIHHDDPFSIVLSFHRFATSIFILASNFPPNPKLVGARKRLEIHNFNLV